MTGNEPIAPITFRQVGETEFRVASEKDLRDGIYLSAHPGLTKREHFAAMAMQGLLTYVEDAFHNTSITRETIASDAVKMADALIAELNKEAK